MTSITPKIDLFSLVFLLGAGQGMFLVLALLTLKKGERQANRFLALFTLTFSITLIDVFMEYTRYYARVPWLLGVVWPTNYLYGPLLLLYTHALVKKGWTPSGVKTLLHFLPFALAWIVLVPVFMLSGDVKTTLLYGDAERLLETSTDGLKLQLLLVILVVAFVSITTIVQIGVYLVIVLKDLREHGRRLKDEFSYTDYVSLNWLRYITIASLFLWLFFAFNELLAERFQIETQSYYAQHVLIAILIYTMGYLGLKQPQIFQDRIMADTDNTTLSVAHAAGKGEKYGKSSLGKEQAAQLALQLKEKMGADSLYLDSRLTLPRLAGAMAITPHYLSQVINGELGKNFFDFVNEYRIEEAKRRIENADIGRLNVFAIALDSGFSSKSAFYSAFKRYTGMTPSEYKAKLTAES